MMIPPTTTATTAWVRVNARHRCPVCGKGDWCSVSGDGGAAICMRVEPGSIRMTKNGGFLHRLGERRRDPFPCSPAPEPPARHDLPMVAQRYFTAISPTRRALLARQLGLTERALKEFHVGWSHDHNAYAFPMMDATCRTVGIRLRTPMGRKFAVKGGREGLFIPRDLMDDIYPEPGKPHVPLGRLFIVEGPTDAGALVDLGFNVVGRPSCTGGIRQLVSLCRRVEPTQVVIVADADEPGQRGATSLSSVLRVYVPDVVMITPPAKDVREWLLLGCTHADVIHAVEQTAGEVAA